VIDPVTGPAQPADELSGDSVIVLDHEHRRSAAVWRYSMPWTGHGPRHGATRAHHPEGSGMPSV
jgi:hypothetical protein